eukprot:Gb_08618 [translate_table: standard]
MRDSYANSTSITVRHKMRLFVRLFHNIIGSMGNPPIAFYINTYASLLQACANMKALREGKLVHARMLITGTELDVFLGTILVSMYAKCGSFVDAQLVFYKIPKPNVFSWNALIRGYIMHGCCEQVLTLYHQMQSVGIQPDNFTFPFVLKACADVADLQQGKDIHDYIIRSGFESDVYVQNCLLAMYAKCGSIDRARQVFNKMSQRDVVSWNTMIAAYTQNGNCEQALKLFANMHLVGVRCDSVTIASVLPACAQLVALEQGKNIHDYIIKSGFESDVYVGSALVDMYAKCGSLEIARQLFDRMSRKNAVSWNAMSTGYAQSGRASEAMELFRQMLMEYVKPNSGTVASILSASAHLIALQLGKEMHGYATKNGFESDVFVGTALIDMYAKYNCLESASKLFDKLFERNVVSWNAMIAGYVQKKHPNEALKYFRQMQQEDVTPNAVTIAIILSACACLAALQLGKEIHDYIIRTGLQSIIFVANALIDMYAKCGSIEVAGYVFDQMSVRDVVSWNAMIMGYGIHGYGQDALTHFEQMQQAGIKPDHITFIGVLSACSHAGLVNEGWRYFDCMRQDYHITPTAEHYACMVDLLGRAGQLDEAHDFIKRMPLDPVADVWGALLGACRNHCNIDLGEHVAECLFELEPENTANYVLLSNIYAEAGKWDDVAKVRTMMKEKGLMKRPGCSWIKVKNMDHAFYVGDRSHPQSEKIYAMLETLAVQMKDLGYVPDHHFVLQNVEDDGKEYVLCGHSEKLAIAFGLINTSPGTTIQITKNLRVCGDCHSATKFISKIVGREIIPECWGTLLGDQGYWAPSSYSWHEEKQHKGHMTPSIDAPFQLVEFEEVPMYMCKPIKVKRVSGPLPFALEVKLAP